MKKKIVLALLATLTLTLGTFGTVFAMNGNPGIELQANQIFKQGGNTEEHTHTWGNAQYVVDKPAEYEQNWVVDKEAVYEQNWVVDKEAVYDEVKVVDQEAVYRDVTEVHTICKVCGKDFTAAGMTNTDVQAHIKQEALAGQMGGYYEKEVVVGQELVSPEISHMETVLVSPEEGHYENGALISPEEGHYENGDLISPEEGHWEHTCTVCGEIQNRDTGEVIKPGTLPEEPENPGTDEPDTEEPENPNTGDNTGDQTETPSEDTENPTDDSQNPVEDTQDTDNNKQDQQDNSDKTTTTETTDKNDKTEQTADNKAQAASATTAESNENTAPQTGDTASLISLFTLAGSSVVGGTAFGLRRKLKK